MAKSDWIVSKCGWEKRGFCGMGCGQEVVEHEGRWFITMGHAGFNTKANNAQGYASKMGALSVAYHCANKSELKPATQKLMLNANLDKVAGDVRKAINTLYASMKLAKDSCEAETLADFAKELELFLSCDHGEAGFCEYMARKAEGK